MEREKKGGRERKNNSKSSCVHVISRHQSDHSWHAGQAGFGSKTVCENSLGHDPGTETEAD